MDPQTLGLERMLSQILPAVPAGTPFTVSVRLIPHVLRNCRAQLVLATLTAALMTLGGVVLLTSGESTVYVRKYGIGEVPAAPIVWLAFAVALVSLASPFFTAFRQLSAGPAIGADKDGVYVRPSLDPKRTLFLPWDEVRLIAVRRMNGPNLCVCPADPRVESPFTVANSAAKGHAPGRGWGLAAAQQRRTKNLGTNIFVPIGGADRPAAEIVDTLRQWSSGRVPAGA